MTTVCFADKEAISGGASNRENDVVNSFVKKTYWFKFRVSFKTVNNLKIAVLTESYSEPCQTSKMGRFAKITAFSR